MLNKTDSTLFNIAQLFAETHAPWRRIVPVALQNVPPLLDTQAMTPVNFRLSTFRMQILRDMTSFIQPQLSIELSPTVPSYTFNGKNVQSYAFNGNLLLSRGKFQRKSHRLWCIREGTAQSASSFPQPLHPTERECSLLTIFFPGSLISAFLSNGPIPYCRRQSTQHRGLPRESRCLSH